MLSVMMLNERVQGFFRLALRNVFAKAIASQTLGGAAGNSPAWLANVSGGIRAHAACRNNQDYYKSPDFHSYNIYRRNNEKSIAETLRSIKNFKFFRFEINF